jgi:hypothetical protein
MNYIVVREDKVVRRWEISETDKVSAATSFLLFMPYDDWRKLIGDPQKGETFEQIETEYIKSRGWTNDNN